MNRLKVDKATEFRGFPSFPPHEQTHASQIFFALSVAVPRWRSGTAAFKYEVVSLTFSVP